MARVWSSGFELDAETINVEFTNGFDVNITIQNTIVRSGNFAGRLNGSGGENRFETRFASGDPSDVRYFSRIYIRIATLPSALTSISALVNSSGIGKARIRLAADGSLELWNNTAKIGNSSGILDTDKWYMIELAYEDQTGTVDSYIEGKLEGISFASDASSNTTGGVSHAQVGNMSINEDIDIYFDDWAINQNSGDFQNSWPGPGAIVHLKPSGAGDNSDWTGDFTDIDEVTPDDVATFINSNTEGQIEDVDIDNTPAELEGGDTISVVQLGVRYAGESSKANSSFNVRIKKVSAGTVSFSPTIIPSSATWRTNANSSPWLHPLTLYKDPDSNNWTKATLNTAQIGARIMSGERNDARISTMWLLVEYISGEAPPTPEFIPRPPSVRLRGPLFSLTARGWLGKGSYKTSYFCRNPYPFAFLPRIFRGYSMPAFGLFPYAQFISQYYSTAGWIYQRRRTWHGITWIAEAGYLTPISATPQQIANRSKFGDAVAGWQALTAPEKLIWNNYPSPRRMAGYGRYLSAYLKDKPGLVK